MRGLDIAAIKPPFPTPHKHVLAQNHRYLPPDAPAAPNSVLPAASSSSSSPAPPLPPPPPSLFTLPMHDQLSGAPLTDHRESVAIRQIMVVNFNFNIDAVDAVDDRVGGGAGGGGAGSPFPDMGLEIGDRSGAGERTGGVVVTASASREVRGEGGEGRGGGVTHNRRMAHSRCLSFCSLTRLPPASLLPSQSPTQSPPTLPPPPPRPPRTPRGGGAFFV